MTDEPERMTLAELCENLRDTCQLARQGTRGDGDSPVWLTVADLEQLLDAAELMNGPSLTLAQVRNGTGWKRGTRFVSIPPPAAGRVRGARAGR